MTKTEWENSPKIRVRFLRSLRYTTSDIGRPVSYVWVPGNLCEVPVELGRSWIERKIAREVHT